MSTHSLSWSPRQIPPPATLAALFDAFEQVFIMMRISLYDMSYIWKTRQSLWLGSGMEQTLKEEPEVLAQALPLTLYLPLIYCITSLNIAFLFCKWV